MTVVMHGDSQCRRDHADSPITEHRGVAVLAGIMAHKWMYNKQKELEAMHTQSKPAPPKQIRLVSAPAAPATPAALPTSEAPEKVNLLPESPETADTPLLENKVAIDIAEIAGGALLGGVASGDKKKEEEVQQDPSVLPPQPEAVKIGPGTIQIGTAGGPVEVQAQDAATAKVLNQQAGKLTKLMGVFQAQPSLAAA